MFICFLIYKFTCFWESARSSPFGSGSGNKKPFGERRFTGRSSTSSSSWSWLTGFITGWIVFWTSLTGFDILTLFGESLFWTFLMLKLISLSAWILFAGLKCKNKMQTAKNILHFAKHQNIYKVLLNFLQLYHVWR